MSRVDDGRCDACACVFHYYLVHSGFSDACSAYCRRCGMTAVLGAYGAPAGVKAPIGEPLPATSEGAVARCACGGTFSGSASPRCSHCHSELSPERATAWIEENAPGARQGWRWQRSWQGLYCIVIENRVVCDNWILPASPP